MEQQSQESEGGKVGRPAVGPVVRAAVPPEVHRFILKRQRAQRSTMAAVTRSLIIAGYEATRGKR